MAKNYIEQGEVLLLTAPYETLSGAGAIVANVFGVALTDIANGATGPYAIEGVYELNKLSTDVIALGAVVYWDNSNKRVTGTAHLNYKIGVATAAVGNPSSTVKVRLDGVSTKAEA